MDPLDICLAPAAGIMAAALPLVREPALLGGLLVAVALSTATLAATSLIRRDRTRHGPACRRLCRALGVTTMERRLLERAAREVRAPSAALLVSRGCFDAAVERLAPDREQARRLQAIRRKVFGA